MHRPISLTSLFLCAVLLLAAGGTVLASSGSLSTAMGRFVVHSVNPQTKSVLVGCTLVGLTPVEDVTVSFANSWGPAGNLRARIKDLSVSSLAGERIECTRSEQVGYTFTGPQDGIAIVSYRLDLSGKRSRDEYHNCDSLDDHKLILIGGSGLFTWSESGPNPAVVEIDPPKGWRVTSNCQRLSDGSYQVPDTREGVFLAATFSGTSFAADGVQCIIAVDQGFLFASADVRQWVAEIVSRQKAIWGAYPVDRLLVVMGNYPFPVAGTSLGGQYIDGAVIFFGGTEEAARESDETPKAFYKTLAHEMFHAGNPAMLKPDDRESQVWWGEGATEYMAFKTTLANGRMTRDEFLEQIAKTYADGLTSTYVRDLSLTDASKNRFDSGSIVYGKGMLAAMALDLALRNSGGRIGSIEALFSEIVRRGRFGDDANQPSLMEYLKVAGVGDLAKGLISAKGMEEITRVFIECGLKVEKAQKAYFGLGLEAENKIGKVFPETAAEKAGLKAGDVILAVNGRELEDFAQLKEVIDSRRIGELVILTVDRDGEELKVPLTVGKRDDSKLVLDDEAPDRVKAVLARWLAGR
jgi:predicted metalloprotease with PDZ domain